MTADEKSRRPANTAFKQQRLKAWQPILTPKTVLPTLFIIGIIFAPIGGILFYVSENVTEIGIDYSKCMDQTNGYAPVPKGKYWYSLPTSKGIEYKEPRYKATTVTLNETTRIPGSSLNDALTTAQRCTISFHVPVTLKAPVYMYYRLTHFYQNHRKYVKSFDADQLKGVPRMRDQVNGTSSCADLPGPGDTNQVYYPCGLIANSMFNDTISTTLVPLPTNANGGAENPAKEPFTFSNTGITWASDKDKYKKPGYTAADLPNILPPPNWAIRYKDGKYNSIEELPQLDKDEHFQVWMRTAGLPNFRKLYGRSDNKDIPAGFYTLDIDYHFSTEYYGGTKAIVISTVSFLGGKNPFLGIAYITVAVVCVIMGCVFTLRHLYKPRKLGDHTYLSWNQQGAPMSGSAGASSPDGPRSPIAG